MEDDEIVELAIKAGCPSGWYSGPWFDDGGKLQTGVPSCLRNFAQLVVEYIESTTPDREDASDL